MAIVRRLLCSGGGHFLQDRAGCGWQETKIRRPAWPGVLSRGLVSVRGLLGLCLLLISATGSPAKRRTAILDGTHVRTCKLHSHCLPSGIIIGTQLWHELCESS